jgi:hypothetical protein
LENDPGTAKRNRLQTAKAQLLRIPTIIEEGWNVHEMCWLLTSVITVRMTLVTILPLALLASRVALAIRVSDNNVHFLFPEGSISMGKVRPSGLIEVV